MAAAKIHHPRHLGGTGPTLVADPVIWVALCVKPPSVRRRRFTITMANGVEQALR